MTGSYIIVDLSQSPPAIVDADQVLPALVAVQLADINRKLDDIMTAESSYQSDIATLQAFFQDLQTQLGNIKSQQVSAGVTDTSALDQLAAQAASLQPAVDNMAAGSVPGGGGTAAPTDTSGAPVDPNAPAPGDGGTAPSS